MSFDARKACSGEGTLRVGQVRDAQAGEHAEGKVERADVGSAKGPQQWMARDLEVGDHPEAAALYLFAKTLCECIDLRLGQAVEEEVRDDEVGVWRSVDFQGRTVNGTEASGGGRGRLHAAPAKQVEHRGAGVDGGGVQRGVLLHQSSEEAAVAIAQDEGVRAALELRKEVEADVLQQSTQREVLRPAIEACDTVEVGRRRHRKTALAVEDEEDRCKEQGREQSHVCQGTQRGAGEALPRAVQCEEQSEAERACQRWQGRRKRVTLAH